LPEEEIELRAAALTWILRFKEGLAILPLDALSDKPEFQEAVQRIKLSIDNLMKKFDVERVIAQLKNEYFTIGGAEERQAQENRFLLLGNNERAVMNFDERTGAGEDIRVISDLQLKYKRANPSKLFANIIAETQAGSAAHTALMRVMTQFKKSYALDDARRPKPDQRVLPSYDIRSSGSFEDYVRTKMGIPDEVKKHFGLSSNVLSPKAQRALVKMNDIYTNPQEIADLDQEGNPILDELRRTDPKLVVVYRKHPQIFFKRDGKLYVMSLHDIRYLVRDNKYDATPNPAKDVQSLIDSIYDPIQIYLLKPYVSYIITEEREEVVKGALKLDEDEPNLVFILDPVDGSTGIEVGSPYGIIGVLAYTHRNQDLSTWEGRDEFRGRRHLIAGFDYVFGFPRTQMKLVNRAAVGADSSSGNSEVIQFELLETEDRTPELKYAFKIEPFTRFEENVEFDGWLPVIADNPHNQAKGIGFGMGGSISSFLPRTGNAALMLFVMHNLGGHIQSYVGGFVADLANMVLMPSESVHAIIHSYSATRDYKEGRYRFWFELLFYALLFNTLKGSLTNGFDDILDVRPPEHESGQPSPAYSESFTMSPFIAKFQLAVRHQFRKDFPDTPPVTLDEALKWLFRFEKLYRHTTRKVTDAIVGYSRQSYDAMPLTEKEVREAMFQLPGHVLTNEYTLPTGVKVDISGLAELGADQWIQSDGAAARIYDALFSQPGARLAARDAYEQQSPVFSQGRLSKAGSVFQLALSNQERFHLSRLLPQVAAQTYNHHHNATDSEPFALTLKLQAPPNRELTDVFRVRSNGTGDLELILNGNPLFTVIDDNSTAAGRNTAEPIASKTQSVLDEAESIQEAWSDQLSAASGLLPDDLSHLPPITLTVDLRELRNNTPDDQMLRIKLGAVLIAAEQFHGIVSKRHGDILIALKHTEAIPEDLRILLSRQLRSTSYIFQDALTPDTGLIHRVAVNVTSDPEHTIDNSLNVGYIDSHRSIPPFAVIMVYGVVQLGAVIDYIQDGAIDWDAVEQNISGVFTQRYILAARELSNKSHIEAKHVYLALSARSLNIFKRLRVAIPRPLIDISIKAWQIARFMIKTSV